MSGSQASEFRVTTAIDDHLKATFDIRVYANGEIKTDVIVTNETTYTANPKTYTYDVAIKQGGATVYTEAGVQQWHGLDLASRDLQERYAGCACHVRHGVSRQGGRAAGL